MDIDPSIKYAQHNHVAEAIYVSTDPTGRSDGIEYACLLTNMMPKSAKKDQFNYEQGSHPITTMDIEFSAVKYESPQINTIARALIDKFQTIKDYLNFNSEYTTNDVANKYKSKIINWPDEFNQNLSE